LRTAGRNLRTRREKLGLTMRGVELASDCIAEKYRNEQFSIPPSRLSDIETKGLRPCIYRIYTLSVIYRLEPRKLLSWYGLEIDNTVADLDLVSPPRSHLSDIVAGIDTMELLGPTDPVFDNHRSNHLVSMVKQWGLVPLSYVAHFATSEFTYGYVGSQDFTMYPLLPPGAFIQVDETLNEVLEGTWPEYERPIYFVETRDGFTCCWCSIHRDQVILQPHPLSPAQVRVLRHHHEVEVVGRVVGVAARLVAT